MPLERPTTVMEIVAVVVVLKERDIEPTMCQFWLTKFSFSKFKSGWWENDVITINHKQTNKTSNVPLFPTTTARTLLHSTSPRHCQNNKNNNAAVEMQCISIPRYVFMYLFLKYFTSNYLQRTCMEHEQHELQRQRMTTTTYYCTTMNGCHHTQPSPR